MSSISEDDDQAPLINTDTSKGSSVSSGMQEEYNELLKYAIVTPKWEPQICVELPNVMPALRLQEPNDVPLTTVDQYSGESDSSRSNDGHDSAMGSEEVTTGRRTCRDPLTDRREEDNDKSMLQSSIPRNPIFASTAVQNQSHRNSRENDDADYERMNQQLNTWNAKLNNMVLTEFGQMKMALEENYRRLLHAKELEQKAQMDKLQDELENMKELLHAYEKSLERKDSVISNLTRALQTSKDRQEMARALAQWKFRFSDQKREAFTAHLARRHREHALATRAWQAWRSTIEGSWKGKIETACQLKAQEVCVQLTDDYEDRVTKLETALTSSRAEVQLLQNEREKYEETMKKAFMRGVCALNLEAMTMFHNQEGQDGANIQTLSAAVDALSCASFPPGASSAQQHPDPPTSAQSRPPVFQSATSSVPFCFREYNHVPSNIHHSKSVPTHLSADHRSEDPVPRAPPNPIQLQQVPRKSQKKLKNPKVLNVKVSTAGNGRCKANTASFGAPPASVLVKRHHPNVQNIVTKQPLKHMGKYPNTPVQPIKGQQ